MTLSRNATHRLRKSATLLEQALDRLYQVQGLLYPHEVSSYRDKITAPIATIQALSQAIDKAMPPTSIKPPPADKAKPRQLDIEDPFVEEAAE
jgi:hypothetical protein